VCDLTVRLKCYSGESVCAALLTLKHTPSIITAGTFVA